MYKIVQNNDMVLPENWNKPNIADFKHLGKIAENKLDLYFDAKTYK